MKKISILSLHLGYGGIEKSICSLANMLCSEYEVEIACCYNIYNKCCFDLDDRVKVIYLNDTSIVPNRCEVISNLKKFKIFSFFKEALFSLKVLYLRYKKMTNYIKNCTSNVIISSRDIFNVWTGKYARSGILKIGWEHNHFHDNMKYAKKIIKSVEKLDYFVLVSSSLKDFYSKHCSIDCVCIPNCIDYIPDKCSSLSKKNFISVGRLSFEKGYIDLLKVMEKIKEIYPDWHLDIIGDGKEMNELSSYIESHNLTNVKLCGFQDKNYINKRLLSSSIYLMTSHTESFGIVLIEAMSFGLPCIAFSSAEGALEIIQDGKNGFLIENRDIDLMVEKISELIENNDLRKKMGKFAFKSINKYSCDVVSKKWFKIIEEGGSNE